MKNYPDKPIRIVAAQPKGGNDFSARVIAQGLTSRLGLPVLVDNLPGGRISAETVLEAPPDGYTLLSADNQSWIEPLLRKAPYDAARDFAPVIAAINAPFALYVHSSVPAESIAELIALAKASPGKLKYGSGGPGSSSHLATELLKSMAGIDILRVPYSGIATAVSGLAAGEVQMLFASATAVAPHLRSGKLKALAVAGSRPSALFPGLPAIAETLPGYETVQVYGILAPAKTPAPIIQRLNQEIAQVLNSAEVKERLQLAGVEVVANTSEAFAALIKTEIARWGKLVRESGFSAA